ncbi:nucleotide sugar dehydrogenase [archaeon]|nr:MAG: nucleotide sugar dehydrogenase [archaeon]
MHDLEKLHDNTLTIGIVGVGYVGLPLAMCFSKVFTVIGYDTSSERIALLEGGRSYIDDVTDATLADVVGTSFFPTNDHARLAECDVILICVPTPVKENHVPDLGPVENATKTIASILRKGQTVVLESTTYPGTMEEVMRPILESSGLSAGTDFFLAYSPERIDPGNKHHTIYNTPKVVGGMDERTTTFITALYQKAINAPIVSVSNIRTAEATKIFENVFRAVNIALVNELSIVFDHMGINTWEVIQAASSKPMGFMAHYPGVGVGGHCIPVDPYYLSYKARKCGHTTRFIELAGQINSYMPVHATYLALDAMAHAGVTIHDASVTVLGVTYKPNTMDTRDSPSFDIIRHLQGIVKTVTFHDPFVDDIVVDGSAYKSVKTLEEALNCDCAILAVDHEAYRGVEALLARSNVRAVVDGKNFLDSSSIPNKVYRGIGKGGMQ